MIRLNVANPIVLDNGTISQEFLDWVLEVSTWSPILGNGSPEGVIEAPLYSLYIDKDGTTGAIQYRKMSSEIGGDRKQGWVLV